MSCLEENGVQSDDVSTILSPIVGFSQLKCIIILDCSQITLSRLSVQVRSPVELRSWLCKSFLLVIFRRFSQLFFAYFLLYLHNLTLDLESAWMYEYIISLLCRLQG